jgi:hypothetical protein
MTIGLPCLSFIILDPVRTVFPQWVAAISHTVDDNQEDCHAKPG